MEEIKEMMDEEIIEEEMDEETEGRSGMPTGLAMLLGGGLALGAVAGFKKLKKVWSERKANKEMAGVVEPIKPDNDSEIVEADFNEVN